VPPSAPRSSNSTHADWYTQAEDEVLDLVHAGRIVAPCEGWGAVIDALEDQQPGRYDVVRADGQVVAEAYVERNGNWTLRGGRVGVRPETFHAG
jgi:hypothetical protein